MPRKVRGVCSVESCDRPHKARGWCQWHWERDKRGVPLDAPRNRRPEGRRYGKAPAPVEDKVLARFGEPGTGCWEWSGSRTPLGYGQVCGFDMGKRKFHYTHRIAYTIAKGQIPDGLVIDHLCSNPPCYNPEHLEAVTQAENLRRARA